MINDGIKTQVLCACDEIEFVACELPKGSVARLAIVGFAATLRREYDLRDVDKHEILLRRLERTQPIAKSEFADFLDFSRSESKSLIDSMISAGMIEQFQEETTNDGRPRTLLRLP